MRLSKRQVRDRQREKIALGRSSGLGKIGGRKTKVQKAEQRGQRMKE